MLTVFIVSAVSLVVALNFYATARVVRSDCYEVGQKASQAVLIWFVPLLGALLVLQMMTNELPNRQEYVEQVEHTDRYNLNGGPTPWSGSHD
jgi:hypothetical protein